MGLRRIEETISRAGGVGQGFHSLRLVLALGVVVVHSFRVTGVSPAVLGTFWVWTEAFVPMFFAVSGFLVSRSLDRRPLRDYAVNRAGRILPGLTLVTLITAFLLGPMVTTNDTPAYFANADTYRYLANIVVRIQYFLPGVFIGHPDDRIVNVSLWSIPWEVGCYIALAMLCAARLWQRHWFVTLAAVLVICTPLLSILLHAFEPVLPQAGPRLARVLRLLGDWEARTIAYFASGVLISRYSHLIPYKLSVALVAAIAATVLSLLTTEEHDAWAITFSAPLLAYIAIFIGCSGFRLPFAPKSDLSYGIYLFGYPVQQTVYHVSRSIDPALNLALSLPIVFLAATLSWHLIEHPALKLIARRRHRTTSGRSPPFPA